MKGDFIMPTCKCIVCNKEFYSKRNAKLCDECRTRTCSVCGKIFSIDPSQLNKTTCSRKCKQQESQLIKEGKLQGQLKICEYCGKPFYSNHNRRRYCYDDHYATCQVCGKRFKIVHMDSIPATCSEECKRKQTVSTVQSKYGVDYVFQDEGFKTKAKQSNIDRYGVDNPAKSDEIKDKVRQSFLSNYGVTHPRQLKEVVDKQKRTLAERYGTPYARMTDPCKYAVYHNFQSDPATFIYENFNQNPTIQQIMDLCGVNYTTVVHTIHSAKCEDLVKWSAYSLEQDIKNFIQSISNTTILMHDRSLISPYEVDMYLPEFKLAIECNPTVTHNSSIEDPWGGPPKDKCYHQMKSKRCQEQGVQLIHVFGYEWEYKQDIIKSILRNKLKCNEYVYYARKLTLDDKVPYLESAQFLNENHRQGNCVSANVRLGLRDSRGELLALMTFGKVRNSISKSSDSCDDDMELLRFCTKLNTSVVGGCSKLFKYYVRNFPFHSIISYSDFARTSGSVYSKLGFEFERLSTPGYMWVHISNDTYLTRVACQKQNISKTFGDCDIDLSMTESQIMTSLNYVRVYDSGACKWIYR